LEEKVTNAVYSVAMPPQVPIRLNSLKVRANLLADEGKKAVLTPRVYVTLRDQLKALREEIDALVEDVEEAEARAREVA
jgi:hypothetical protein